MSSDPLLQDLRSKDPGIRLAAVEAAAAARYQAAVPALLLLLQDPDASVRAASADALGVMQVGEAVNGLTLLLGDPESRVRAAAISALRHIGSEAALDALARTPIVAIDEGDDVRATLRIPRDDFWKDDPTLLLAPKRAQAAVPAIVVPVAPQIEAQSLPQAHEVQFSAYFPSEAEPQRWLAMNAYIFKAFAAEAVIADAQRLLGGQVKTLRRLLQASQQGIPSGTVVTATPHLPGVQFNPPHDSIAFYEDWQRFNFKLRVVDAPLNQAVNGSLTFTVEGVIVSTIPLSVYVTDASTASTMVAMTQKLYKAIFCSYSHQDSAVVERVEAAYQALGFDFLRDVRTLKSGQDWDDALYALIEKADIFQLFWSQAAAHSEYVEREWRHALTLKREENSFIRPVYWQQPMPPAPRDLAHIHFAYEPELAEE